jgi:group I intron endonuclease
MYIYIIENKIDGKIYIGCTTKNNPVDRWKTHKRRKSTSHFHNALEKYGRSNFIFTPVEFYSSIEELEQAEIYWIAEMRRILGRDNVYNIHDGGSKGAYGRIVSQETRAKQSAAKLGRKLSEETKRKMSQSRMGKHWKMSAEQIEKNAKKHIGKSFIKITAKCGKKDIPDILELIKTGMTQKQIGIKYGVTQSTVAHLLQRNRS